MEKEKERKMTGDEVLDQWTEFILSTTFEEIPEATVYWAKMRIMDILGCIVAGATAPGNRELIGLLRRWGGAQEASVLMYGLKIPLPWAAFANSILARSLDFGPVDPEFEGQTFPGHVSETSIPAALSIAEFLCKDGKELLRSLVIGEDLVCRLAAASEFDPLTHGWDDLSVVNPFGVVAIYGGMMQLDRKQLKNAFGILLALLSGSFQMTQDRTTAFKLPQGIAAKNGIFAVELARAGWTGPRDPFFSEYGYFSLFTPGVRRKEVLTKDLGKKYHTDRTIKPYPCCRLAHSSIDALLYILNKYKLNIKKIIKLIIEVPEEEGALSIAEEFRVGDFPQANVIFNYYYPLATVLVDGQFLPKHHFQVIERLESIKDLIRRIEIRVVRGLHRGETNVIVITDEREIAHKINCARGDRQRNPLSSEEVEEKFRRNLIDYGGERFNDEKITRIIQKIYQLEKEEVRDIINYFS